MTTDLNHLLVSSPNINQERLDALRGLFPDLFTNEGKPDPLALRQLVEGDNAGGREQYTFTWHGKARSKRHAFTPSRAALTYDSERSVNPDKAAGNMIIEGENLEVLKLLTSAYREKVKCIYIDPPYNTGGDFIYPDNYAKDRKEYWEENGSYQNGVKMDTNPETNGRYHSDWLSMMYSRLLIARQLLREDGVIFVSIDDNEVHNLRKIMDEVFGEENFVTEVVWYKRVSPANDAKWFSGDHDYLLVYAKVKEIWRPNRLPRTEKQKGYYTNPDNDPRGPWNSATYTGPKSKEERPNLYYPIINPNTGQEVWPKDTAVWAYSKELHEEHVRQNLLYWGKSGSSKVPRLKTFLSEAGKVVPRSVWHYDQTGHTQEATQELMEMFPEGVFPSPKSVRLLKQVLRIATESLQNDLCLDFFAGSGTFGQAVMQVNREDSGNRKFILVQLPEVIEESQRAFAAGFRTVSDITIERCKRVIEGYGDNPQPFDTGFKVYRLTKSHFPRAEFQPDPDKSEEDNIAALKKYIAEKEANFQMVFDRDKIFDEVLLKYGFTLDYSLSRQEEFAGNAVYLADDGTRQALICLDLGLTDETVEMLRRRTDRLFICLERALDTTKKWNLKHSLGERLKAV